MTRRIHHGFLFRTDSTIKRDVEDEIKYDPSIQHDETIAVAVKDGIVTLSGVTKSYMDSYYAEKAAKRVSGLRRSPTRSRSSCRPSALIPRLPKTR
jgi:hypothetical protein